MVSVWVLLAVGILWAGTISWLVVSASRDRLVKRRMRDEVIVTLKGGEAFRGILVDADARSFVLRDAKALSDTYGSMPVDGEVIFDRARVDFFQRPGN